MSVQNIGEVTATGKACFNIREEVRVYRFKCFDSAECGDSMSALEAMINAWMESERPRIRYMSQTLRGEHILLSFVFEESRELEKRVVAQAQTSPLPRFFDDDDFFDDRPSSAHIPSIQPPQAH